MRKYILYFGLICFLICSVSCLEAETLKKGKNDKAIYRIICGATEKYIDHKGNIWIPDTADEDAGLFYIGMRGHTVDRGNREIRNTKDDKIYQTERCGLEGYNFDLPNSLYTIRLHFAETFAPGKNRRVFDVFIQDKKVLKNLDIFAEVGMNSALVKEFKNIKVTDEQLTITFSPAVGMDIMEINGIEIISY